MPSADKTALQVGDVTKRFGGLIAVQKLSFALAENEVLGLIGPNGSGKTTMMNLISGALRPTSGEIRLYGDDDRRGWCEPDRRQGNCPNVSACSHAARSDGARERMAGGVFGHTRRWGKDATTMPRLCCERVGLPNAGDIAVTALTYIDQKRVELARALAIAIRRCCCLTSGWPASIRPN